MPFTPIHFGPGLLLKAVAPERFSFTAFAAANIVIDLEPLYHMLRGDQPLHGPFHTLLGATALGLLSGITFSLLAAAARRAPVVEAAVSRLPNAPRAELHLSACILGGLVGGVSHSLLDSLIYSDFHPLAPFSMGNPLLKSVPPDTLSRSLLVMGLVGATLLAGRILIIRRAV